MTAETPHPSPAANLAEEGTPDASAKPLPLLIGATITMVEGLALTGWGINDVITGLAGNAANLGRSEFGAVILLVMGLLPLLAGWALFRLRRWGRSPAVLTNSICLPVAYYMCQAGGPMVAGGVLIGLLGVAGIFTLLNPRVTAALYG